MNLTGLNRSLKTRILFKLFEGQTAPLASLRKPLSPDLSQWTNEELQTEYERIRQKQYRQTGVLPPPMPDFGAMSLEQLHSYKADRFKALY
ncbi:hypothetical protein [Spirosoma fluviale]|uniref:Uncharacterized protein n=1 Tax=Spirosoma fluviale TaxID=1597977 RepID=A0A286GW93_9BACT|nr:hypothetical protein [Spirosoma fluviale]SOD99790.1 hypothetical protein SAMN06269250_0167 [Spirosoma fluviale]